MATNDTATDERELIVERAGASVRLQALGEATVRVELAREDGSFCNDSSFTVESRTFGSCQLDAPASDAIAALPDQYEAIASFCGMTLAMPIASADPRSSIADLVVFAGAREVYAARSDPGLIATPPQPDKLPRPGDVKELWVLHDRPRVVPPPWGSTAPPPDVAPDRPGWTVEEGALDLYFIACDGEYNVLVRELLGLTGHPPLPPRWAFGLWHSRYYPYTEESAIKLIDEYESRDIPLDVFVLDTDWRVGASRGYEISTEHFPDMERFLRHCADGGIRTLFNDHPEPRGLDPLDPELFSYRQRSLNRILDMGLTSWWFDRNWKQIITGPVDGLETGVWGQKLYYDIMNARPGSERVLLLSNVAPHPSAHRYPLHWTGDIRSDWQSLAAAVRDSIVEGYQLCGYTGQDLGGHSGFPSPEQYVRWVQWGSVSPTMRLHCGPRNRFREPWRFGDDACSIAADYIRFRYRLLPLLYSLAYENHCTGRPLLRGMEFAGPKSPAWASDTQFLLGDDLLFQPVATPADKDSRDRHPAYFREPLRRRVWRRDVERVTANQAPDLPERPEDEIGYDHEIRFDTMNVSELRSRWGSAFYVVWDGMFPVKESGWYRIVLRGNGRKGLTIDHDEEPHMLRRFDGGYREAHLWLSAGNHHLQCGYEHDEGITTELMLSMTPVAAIDDQRPVKSSVWLPPGRWRELVHGAVHEGDSVAQVSASPHEIPGFARLGSILPVGPVRSRTTGLTKIVCDIFVDSIDFAARATIYDDDGETTAHLRGEHGVIAVTAERRGTSIVVGLEQGGARLPAMFRLHLPAGEHLAGGPGIQLDAATADARTTPLALSDETAQFSNSETILVELAPGERLARIAVEKTGRFVNQQAPAAEGEGDS